MYDGTYDDYIRSILGYPQNNMYDYNYNDFRAQNNNNISQEVSNVGLENYYPEIYKIVYPMIAKKCQNTRGQLTNDDIENMTDEIYSALEGQNEIQLNINLANNVRTASNNLNSIDKKAQVKVSESSKEKIETRQVNSGLRDLIKILLIRELLNRPGIFPPRPPVRPPMPGPRPPMRPPFRPGPGRPPFSREYGTYNDDIYEI